MNYTNQIAEETQWMSKSTCEQFIKSRGSACQSISSDGTDGSNSGNYSKSFSVLSPFNDDSAGPPPSYIDTERSS